MELDKQTKVADANNSAVEDTALSTQSASPDDAKSRADLGDVHNTDRQVSVNLQEDDPSPPPERQGEGGGRWSLLYRTFRTNFAILQPSRKKRVLATFEDENPPSEREGKAGSR